MTERRRDAGSKPRADSRRRTASLPSASYHAQRRRDHAKETAEDYVECIADLIRLHGEARVIEIARFFGVSHVTVNRTAARLQRDGYVALRPYRAIFLTPEGTRLAERARTRHEIVVRFLLTLGVRESTARHDAEGLEHHVSPETLDAMARHTARLNEKAGRTALRGSARLPRAIARGGHPRSSSKARSSGR